MNNIIIGGRRSMIEKEGTKLSPVEIVVGFIGLFAFIMLVRAVVKQEGTVIVWYLKFVPCLARGGDYLSHPVWIWYLIFVPCLAYYLFGHKLWKKVECLFTTDAKFEDELDIGIIPEGLRNKFKIESLSLSENATVRKEEDKWVITEKGRERKYIIKKGGGKLDIYEVKFKKTSVLAFLLASIIALCKKRRERYEEIADEWLANNRVLKVEEVVFILFNRDTWTIESFVCAGRDDFCHRVMMDRWVLGKMIKKRKKELQKVRYVRKISKERLIRSIRISSYFDKEWWSKVDIRLFPEWLTAELVARKLSED